MPRPKGKRAMDAFLEEIKRSDQTAFPPCITLLITDSQRDQADREARFARSCKLTPNIASPKLTLLPEAHARSATAMAGLFCSCMLWECVNSSVF
jgi:hypothetical protein